MNELPIELQGTPVKRWGYEQAFACTIIAKCKRDDFWQDYERHFAKMFGRNIDNKVTFCLEGWGCSPGEIKFYVTFHDSTVYIGLDVRPYRGGELPQGQDPL